MAKILQKLFFIFVWLGAFYATANADEAFRNHRYDSFKVLPECSDSSIIFIGNSITNMMDWNELFGDRNHILNRGVSGAYTDEVLANLDTMIKGYPAKIFLMIGTNDLGTEGEEYTPEKTAGRIGEILERMHAKWPSTSIYYQSILPTLRGKRTKEKTELTNKLVEERIMSLAEDNIKYIDLYTVFLGEGGALKSTEPEFSPCSVSIDGLHLTQKGYKIWADIIKDYVGYSPVIPDNMSNLWGGMDRSNGMRTTYFGVLPVKSTDILLIGDEMIHSGEWSEMLGDRNIKDRGIGWGYPGPGLKNLNGAIEIILKGNVENGVLKEEPKGVCYYGGFSDILQGKNADKVFENYFEGVHLIRGLLPQTPIFLMTLVPLPKDEEERGKALKQTNEKIRTLAEQLPNVFLIDTEKALKDLNGERNENYFMGIFLSGEGYAKVGKIIEDSLNQMN